MVGILNFFWNLYLYLPRAYKLGTEADTYSRLRIMFGHVIFTEAVWLEGCPSLQGGLSPSPAA